MSRKFCNTLKLALNGGPSPLALAYRALLTAALGLAAFSLLETSVLALTAAAVVGWLSSIWRGPVLRSARLEGERWTLYRDGAPPLGAELHRALPIGGCLLLIWRAADGRRYRATLFADAVPREDWRRLRALITLRCSGSSQG